MVRNRPHTIGKLDFILWATSREHIELVVKHEGWIAVPSGTRRSTYQDPRYQREAPFSSLVLTAIETANQTDNTLKPSPYNGIQYIGIPEYPSMGHRVAISIQRVLKQEISIDEALREANLLGT